MSNNKDLEIREVNTAWCPKCFDALEVVEIKNKEGLTTKFEYHCFGCDITYKLVEIKNK